MGSADLLRVLPLPGGHMWRLGQRTRIMGVLNVTPDSFRCAHDSSLLQRMPHRANTHALRIHSDGGSHNSSLAASVDAALRMVAAGADIVDIGGQSTRPGAQRVSEEEEAQRVIPVIAALRGRLGSALLSVDTFYASVARAAAAEGAHIVNDVSGGRLDSGLFSAVADTSALYVLMHSRGDPATMQEPRFTAYGASHAQPAATALTEAALHLQPTCAPRLARNCWRRERERRRVASSPGVCCLTLGLALRKLRQATSRCCAVCRTCAARWTRLVRFGARPCSLAPAAKASWVASPVRLARLLTLHDWWPHTPHVAFPGKEAAERDWATAAAVTACIAGGAEAVRVHNVAAIRDAVLVADAIYR